MAVKRWQFDKDAFVRAIEGRMVAENMDYRTASDQVGVGYATLWRIQKHMPDISTVILVCQWLHTSVDQFVKKDGTK